MEGQRVMKRRLAAAILMLCVCMCVVGLCVGVFMKEDRLSQSVIRIYCRIVAQWLSQTSFDS